MPASDLLELGDRQLARYARHIMLDEIGLEGQRRLTAASAAVIGAGGLGCPAAMLLATAGFRRIVIVDDDTVEEANLQRQFIYRQQDVGRKKAEVAAEALRSAGLDLEVQAHCQRAGDGNAAQLINGCDVVLDATDNLASRHAINRACRSAGIRLVSGAAERFDGQVAAFDFASARSPCYACIYPMPADGAPPAPCATLGVFAPLTGAIGSLMAGEAIKMAAAAGTATLHSRMLAVDLAAMRTQIIAIDPAPGCPVCSGQV